MRTDSQTTPRISQSSIVSSLVTNRVGGRGFHGDPVESTAGPRAAGIIAVCYESPKTGHEWLAWRRSLRERAPLLFKR